MQNNTQTSNETAATIVKTPSPALENKPRDLFTLVSGLLVLSLFSIWFFIDLRVQQKKIAEMRKRWEERRAQSLAANQRLLEQIRADERARKENAIATAAQLAKKTALPIVELTASKPRRLFRLY